MTPKEKWETFFAGHRRWLHRLGWIWTVLVVLLAAAVIWRFGT